MDETATPGRRIGDMAAATGLTVRTLHYYEEIGLLVPSSRTGAGHRLYNDDDVERLYRVCLLRGLGLPLAEIGKALDDPEWKLGAAMRAHRRELARRLAQERRLERRLDCLLTTLDTQKSGLTEDLLTVLEDMTMLETNVQRRISILVYADISAAYDHLVDVFRLGPGRVVRNDEGHAVHGEIEAGDGVIWLHPETAEFGLSSPRSLGGATGTVAVMVDDVDSHFQHARSQGADIVYEPVDQPYGYREYSVRDVEGHLWSFMKPLE